MIINNYPASAAPDLLSNIRSKENTYLNGSLIVKPLTCVRIDSNFRCDLKITVMKDELLIIELATLDSTYDRPYTSKIVGFEAGRSSSLRMAKTLPVGVPVVIFAKFEGVPEAAQQGTLFFPIRLGGSKDTIKLSVKLSEK